MSQRTSLWLVMLCLLVFPAQAKEKWQQALEADLRTAAAAGELDKVREWLGYGADVNAPGQDGNTALHLAAKNGHGAMALLLLENAATAKARNQAGNTPADEAGLAGHHKVSALIRNFEKEAPPPLPPQKTPPPAAPPEPAEPVVDLTVPPVGENAVWLPVNRGLGVDLSLKNALAGLNLTVAVDRDLAQQQGWFVKADPKEHIRGTKPGRAEEAFFPAGLEVLQVAGAFLATVTYDEAARRFLTPVPAGEKLVAVPLTRAQLRAALTLHLRHHPDTRWVQGVALPSFVVVPLKPPKP